MAEEMKQRMDRFDSAVDDLKTVNRRIIATLIRLEGKVDDMSERMATKDDMASLENKLMNHIDGLGSKAEDFNFRIVTQGRAFDDHNARLKKLEGPTD